MNFSIGGKAESPALEDFVLLNEEIAALVRARIPLESNLARIGHQLPGRAGDLALKIGRRLDAGSDIVDAIDTECVALPGTYRAVLVAGVQSGQLGSALEAVVDSATRLDQLRRVTGLALLYPFTLLVLFCLLLALVIKFIAPNFAWLDHSPLRWLSTVSNWPYTMPLLTLVLPSLIIIGVATWWWSSGRLAGAGWPRLGLFSALTGAGHVYRWNEVARFSELLHLLVQQGLPFDRALALAAESTGDRKLRRSADQLARRFAAGDVAAELQPGADDKLLGSFPMLLRVAMHQANDRPLLTASLRQAATTYRERAIRAAEWYAEYLPIVLTVVVGGTFTVTFTLLVIWPYAKMLYNLSQPFWK